MKKILGLLLILLLIVGCSTDTTDPTPTDPDVTDPELSNPGTSEPAPADPVDTDYDDTDYDSNDNDSVSDYGSLDDTYQDDEGIVKLDFDDDGTVDISLLGGGSRTENYTISGNRISIAPAGEDAGIPIIVVEELEANSDFTELTVLDADGQPSGIILKK